MRPAARANLICRIHVDTVAAAQPVDELSPECGVSRVVVTRALDLAEPLSGTTYDEIVKPHALATVTKRIERLANRRRFSDRMARVASRHPPSVAPGAAPQVAFPTVP